MRLVLILVLAIGLCSCATKRALVSQNELISKEEKRSKKPLRKVTIEARSPDLSGSQLGGIAKANPRWWWENADTPVEPWWRPKDPLEERLKSWRRRNPLHNFTHYVIGVADQSCVRYGLAAEEEWHPNGPLNLAVIHCEPLMFLPFVSWRGVFLEGYAGWRSGGNFGLALRRSKASWRWP